MNLPNVRNPVQPKLNKFVHDTCGVNNLHGMPGIIGALAGVLFAGVATYDYYGRSCAPPSRPVPRGHTAAHSLRSFIRMHL